MATGQSDRNLDRLKVEIHRQVVESLDLRRLERLGRDQLRREVRDRTSKMVRQTDQLLGEVEREQLVEDVLDEIFGVGPIERYMSDPAITDILVNGPDQVYIERHGKLEKTETVFADDAHVLQVIQRIAARVGRRIDESSAMVDARLPDGSRVNAIIPPLALGGPILSIRRFGTRLTDQNLLDSGSFTAEMLLVLSSAVRGRLNLMISGGTGTGKTTMLNILSGYIPHSERLVTIEDTAELELRQPHVVRLETRPPNVEGAGEVRQRALVRNSLRMRPDRIIIGEVRGPEAVDMLAAMNTGHEGSMTTIHANDTRDALSRLEMMVASSDLTVPMGVARRQIASALDVIVQLARLQGGARRMVRISELVRYRQRRYVVRDLFEFRQTGVVDDQAVGEFRACGATPTFLERLEVAGISLPNDLFRERALAPGRGSQAAGGQDADEHR
jgi:pilus assembly protein CpaF